MDEIEFTNLTRKIVDAPYCLGDASKGYDCITMLFAVYGDKLPREWKGWTLENYADRWRRGEGRNEIVEFSRSLGKSISPNFMRKGDIIIFPDGPGIYLGDGHIIRIFAGEVEGGKVYPMRLSRQPILDVRRVL